MAALTIDRAPIGAVAGPQEGLAMKRTFPLIQVVAFAVLVAASPGLSGAADVIKFGVSTPLSGPAAPWGIPHKNAPELIFDEINAQGGLDVGGKKYKLEVVAYDHKYVIAEGVATVNRLIAKDGVKYISILGGSVVKAAEETVNEGRVLNLPLAYADGLVSPKNPLTFHAFPSPPETTVVWKWIKERYPQIKRWQTRYTKKYGEWNATSIDFANPAFAFVAAVKKAQSLDQKKIADALTTVEFENLWGKAHFGGKDYYGIGNQILYPMPFSEVKDGVATLVAQLPPP